MSLANLSTAYEFAIMRRILAEQQVDQFAELCAQWFIDCDLGAREWLREIGKAHREELAGKSMCEKECHEV